MRSSTRTHQSDEQTCCLDFAAINRLRQNPEHHREDETELHIGTIRASLKVYCAGRPQVKHRSTRGSSPLLTENGHFSREAAIALLEVDHVMARRCLQLCWKSVSCLSKAKRPVHVRNVTEFMLEPSRGSVHRGVSLGRVRRLPLSNDNFRQTKPCCHIVASK
jgi:hypothetical protein